MKPAFGVAIIVPMESGRYPSDLASYSSLFQRMLDAVFLLDYKTFAIQDANGVAERVLEADRDQLIGGSLARWIEGSEHELLLQCLRVSRRNYYPRTHLFHWRLPAGELRSMRMVFCRLTLSDGRETELIQVIAQDITAEQQARTKAEEYLQKLQDLAITDELTRLYNYRYFKEQLNQEQRRSSRFHNEYSLVFLDLDHFKQYNDRNGHPAGDALLAGLGALIRRICRNVDVPARYGGEEFVVLCPATPSEGGMILAERLRKTVESTPFPHADRQPLGRVTVSIGVAAFPEHGAREDQVLDAADRAVYESKRAGRNRVSLAARAPQSGE